MAKPLSQAQDLEKLGNTNTEYKYDGADRSLLERFPNPMTLGPGTGTVNIVAPEFTSLCPKTGQPDFATIIVDYVPNKFCVESKSWKMYLGSFRNFGEFHESCVRRMANDLIWLLDPVELTVRGEFTPRGGIPFWPEIMYRRPKYIFSKKDLQVNADSEIYIPLRKGELNGIRPTDEVGILDDDGNLAGWTKVLSISSTSIATIILAPIENCNHGEYGDASEIDKK